MFVLIFGIFTHVTLYFSIPNYQLISRQISNQLVRGHKTIGSHLKSELFVIR